MLHRLVGERHTVGELRGQHMQRAAHGRAHLGRQLLGVARAREPLECWGVPTIVAAAAAAAATTAATTAAR